MSPEQTEHIRHLWENTDRTAKQIGAMYGVSNSVIIGKAYRAGWKSYNVGHHHGDSMAENSSLPWPYERTTMGRLDALHRKMDATLAECRELARVKLSDAG